VDVVIVLVVVVVVVAVAVNVVVSGRCQSCSLARHLAKLNSPVSVIVAVLVFVVVDTTMVLGAAVEVVVMKLVDGASVLVFIDTPSQEQADEYRAVPEQAEAYAGTALGEMTVGQADAARGWKRSTASSMLRLF